MAAFRCVYFNVLTLVVIPLCIEVTKMILKDLLAGDEAVLATCSYVLFKG
jgi:hypothetical protein